MGFASQILHMTFIITFMLITFHCTYIHSVDVSLNEAGIFNLNGLQESHSMEGSGDGKENHVKKVSGEDESKEKEALILEKVRVLLGLRSFNIRNPSNGEFEYVSPAPSPSTIEVEAPAPAPAPVLPIHIPSNHPSHHLPPIPPPQKIDKEDRDEGRTKRILIAVFVSIGATCVIIVIGLIWFCQKSRKQRKRSASRALIYSSGGGSRGRSKYVSSQNSVKKVSSDPALDLFYLDSLGTVLEPQPLCVKHHSETANIRSNQNISNCTLQEGEESDREPTKSKSDHVGSVFGEIISVHESAESIKYDSDGNCTLQEGEESDREPTKSKSDHLGSVSGEIISVHESEESIMYDSDGCISPSGGNILPIDAHSSDGCISSSGDKIIPVDDHSSDDESFQSFSDSHSSSRRLSNASAGSLSDTSEIISHNVSNISPCPLTIPMNLAIPSPNPDTISTLASDLHAYPSQAPCNLEQNLQTKQYPPQAPCSQEQYVQARHSPSNCQKGPPPPPPLPPPVHISPLYSSSCSIRIASKAFTSSILPNISSPRNSDSSSGSSQTPKSVLSSSSPNPPKPPVGIPPPPCPPPFLKGNSNPLKGPPPLPSLLHQYMPLGKDGVPLPKLKPLHWDKVRAAPDRSMVWDKLRPSSFELDEDMIESLFGYNLQNSMMNDEAKSKSKTPSPSKHVLEPKRLQNITILSKALNATAEQICYALLQGNGLCLQQLEALVKMVPTKEEEAKLSSYKGDINKLGSAEKFVKAMLNIPFAFSRVEVMLYRETFEDEVVHLRKSFSMLEEACKELRSSRLFLKLLEAVLKTGNRMNVGTIRGGARAFKLDALLKLADVKGIDGKTTLLHFVVQEIVRLEGIRVSESFIRKINEKSKRKNIEEREEDYRRMGLDLVSGLSTELCNVKKTATIDLDVLASSVSNLSDGMAKLQNLVCKDLCMDEKSGNFVHLMRSFLGYAEKNVKELQENEDRVLFHVREITEYFHGDVSKEEANPLRIFVIVRDFLGMLDLVCKEIRSLKVQSSSNPLAPFR